MIISVTNLNHAHRFFTEILDARPYEHGGHFSHVIWGEHDIILQLAPSSQRRHSLIISDSLKSRVIKMLTSAQHPYVMKDFNTGPISYQLIFSIEENCECELLVYRKCDLFLSASGMGI